MLKLHKVYIYIHKHPEHYLHTTSASLTLMPIGKVFHIIEHFGHSIHFVSAGLCIVGFVLHLKGEE